MGSTCCQKMVIQLASNLLMCIVKDAEWRFASRSDEVWESIHEAMHAPFEELFEERHAQFARYLRWADDSVSLRSFSVMHSLSRLSICSLLRYFEMFSTEVRSISI